jgi:hypothetical protein
MIPFWFVHAVALPLMLVAAGTEVTTTACVAFTLPQLLLIVNPTLPLTAPAPQFVVILFVP